MQIVDFQYSTVLLNTAVVLKVNLVIIHNFAWRDFSLTLSDFWSNFQVYEKI